MSEPRPLIPPASEMITEAITITSHRVTATCKECGRVFNMFNPIDAAEWYAGHDCEVG